MSRLRPDAECNEFAERSKIMVGRYAGDTREEIDLALAEALRVDQRLRELS